MIHSEISERKNQIWMEKLPKDDAVPPLSFFKYSATMVRTDNMAVQGDVYERELKALLSGEEKSIQKMVKTCDQKEKEAYEKMLTDPFVVIRAAGSLGVDLVALRWDFSFPIEVKSSVDETMHFSRNPRLSEQANRMKNDCAKSHLLPVYAMRLKGFKGDPWRLFALPMDEQLKGNMGLLQRKIPEVRLNENGNYVMKWNDGLKLSDFIRYTSIE